MKKITTLLSYLLICSFSAFSQVPYNPFTQNIHFIPEPTAAGFGCGATTILAFTQGITTSFDATQWQTDPLKVTICISGFQFNGPLSSVVSGLYASNFDWSYDIANPNCIIGTQNQTLFGTGGNPTSPNPLSSGPLQVSLKVPNNSPGGTPLQANVTLQVPTYMAASNNLTDDNEQVITQTYCIPTVPTLSEWSLIIVALLTLTFGMVFLYKKESALVYAGNHNLRKSNKSSLFNPELYFKVLAIIIGIAILGLLLTFITYSKLTLTDTIGTMLSAMIIAYMVQLYLLMKNKEQ